jgi:putative transcriptional regulator
MNGIKAIRCQLGLTQAAFAAGVGVSQGNVSFYETKDQTVLPQVARSVIALAARHGFSCSFEDVYSETPVLAKLASAADAVHAA